MFYRVYCVGVLKNIIGVLSFNTVNVFSTVLSAIGGIRSEFPAISQSELNNMLLDFHRL